MRRTLLLAALVALAGSSVAADAPAAAKPQTAPAAAAPAPRIRARAKPRAVAGRPAPPPAGAVDEVALTWRPLQTEPVTLAPGVAPQGGPKPRAVAGAPGAAPLKRGPKRLCAPNCVVCDAAGPCVVCAGGHAANEDGVCQPTGAAAPPADATGKAPCGAGCAACEPELGCVACEDGFYLNGAAGCAAMPTLEAAVEEARLEAVASDDADAVVDALTSVVESAVADVNAAAAIAEADAAAEGETAADEEGAREPASAPLVSLADASSSRTQAATSEAVGEDAGGGCPAAGPKCVACDATVPAPAGFASCKTCAPGYYAYAWAPGDVLSATAGLAACHPCARLGCAPGACADGVGCTACPAGAALNSAPARQVGPNGVVGVCGTGSACPVNCVA